MISIDISNEPLRIVTKGHATGAGLAGANLVCCAVSTLMYTLLSAADEKGIVSGITLADGFMDISIKDDPEAECMMRTVVSGLESLALQYPESIKIRKEGG